MSTNLSVEALTLLRDALDRALECAPAMRLPDDDAIRAARLEQIEEAARAIRVRLGAGIAAEREILSACAGPHDVTRAALRELLMRHEVARAGAGYCLVPALAPVACSAAA